LSKLEGIILSKCPLNTYKKRKYVPKLEADIRKKFSRHSPECNKKSPEQKGVLDHSTSERKSKREK
jgi:hypothetical protein